MIQVNSKSSINMNLQQIQAICAVTRHRYNMSAAAKTLGRSQSVLSRQVKALELEVGTRIFVRTRNKVVGLTPEGQRVHRIGERVLLDLKSLGQIGEENSPEAGGELRIATTHVHARYLLPGAIKSFNARFPSIALTLQQCDPGQCRDMISAGEAEIGIITMATRTEAPIVTIPAYRIPRCVIAPKGHPLTRVSNLTLKDLANYPLVAYPSTFSGRTIVEEAFVSAGIKPRIVCSATDADVCKTYVELGMGVAILATVAFDPTTDRGLVAMDAGHLFRPGVLNLVFRKHGILTRPLESFVTLFAPHVPRDLMRAAMEGAAFDRNHLIREAPVALGGEFRSPTL